MAKIKSVLTVCSVAAGYQCFGGPCYLQLIPYTSYLHTHTHTHTHTQNSKKMFEIKCVYLQEIYSLSNVK